MCGLVLQWFIIYNLLFIFSLILQLFTIYHSFAAWCTRKWRMPSTGASSVTSWWCITWRSVCGDDGDMMYVWYHLIYLCKYSSNAYIYLKSLFRELSRSADNDFMHQSLHRSIPITFRIWKLYGLNNGRKT